MQTIILIFSTLDPCPSYSHGRHSCQDTGTFVFFIIIVLGWMVCNEVFTRSFGGCEKTIHGEEWMVERCYTCSYVNRTIHQQRYTCTVR